MHSKMMLENSSDSQIDEYLFVGDTLTLGIMENTHHSFEKDVGEDLNSSISSFDDVTSSGDLLIFDSSDRAHLSVDQVFFTNILLLGFDPTTESKKHSIAFVPEMFKSPNVKGMEVISYFLFGKLNPKETKEVWE